MPERHIHEECGVFGIYGPREAELAHNGNLSNSLELRSELEEQGSIFHTSTDSEVIAYIIVRERLRCGSIPWKPMRSSGCRIPA